MGIANKCQQCNDMQWQERRAEQCCKIGTILSFSINGLSLSVIAQCTETTAYSTGWRKKTIVFAKASMRYDLIFYREIQ